ncbi:hypothetical protein [Kallotenue papyrolyticum]|uniref:baeRF10 domain-containing protein n=1 Tax=Kallotenue papyrolyticum TaxID=1325125 RepID=UPI0004926CF3|nr:hypothetical protein [Kallotenue papyrolyticum]
MIDEILLRRYLDGELDARTTQLVEEAIAQDPALRERVAALRAVEQRYGALEQETFPEAARQTLIERLRHEQVTPRYDLVREDDINQLRALQSAEWPIWSLYLDLSPERRQQEPVRLRFKALAREAEARFGLAGRPRAVREAFAEDRARIEQWLELMPELEGRGLAILCSSELGLWRVFRLPVPVSDRLEVGDRPYLRPLLTLLDEFERYLVVLIDAGTARLVEVFMGEIEDVTALIGNVPRATGDWLEKTLHRHDEYLRRHARAVLDVVEVVWREQAFDWLVIGGTEEARGALRQELSKELVERLAGELDLSPQVELTHILEEVIAIERAHEREVEAQRVEELITTALKGGAAVLGLDHTLLALAGERVRLLVVAEGFHHPGWECSYCHALGADTRSECPLCGAAVRAATDVVEIAMERTLDQRGKIEVLRSAARERLTQHGSIGALLRYALPPAEPEHQA